MDQRPHPATPPAPGTVNAAMAEVAIDPPVAAPAAYFGIACADNAFSGPLSLATEHYGPVAWVGRYLPGYPISVAEAQGLHNVGCAIMPIWQRAQYVWAGSYDDGWNEAQLAAASWRAIGLPPTRVIVGDAEADSPANGPAVLGWNEGLHHAGFAPGLYCNPLNGAGHAAAWRWARNRNPDLAAAIFTAQNELDRNALTRPASFRLATAANGGDGATSVPGYEGDTKFWQVYEQPDNWPLDIDLANPAGYALLWHPHAPVTHLVPDAHLQVGPDAASHVVADLRHGCVVAFTGAITPHWARVTVTTGETQKRRTAAGLVGWLLRADLQTTY